MERKIIKLKHKLVLCELIARKWQYYADIAEFEDMGYHYYAGCNAHADTIYNYEMPALQEEITHLQLLMKIDKLNDDCQWHISKFI